MTSQQLQCPTQEKSVNIIAWICKTVINNQQLTASEEGELVFYKVVSADI